MIVRNQLGLDGLRREAWFSECPRHGADCRTPEHMNCSRYRYWLEIELSGVGGRCVFTMLNPSKASHLKNDPTVAKCCRFAQRFGFGRVGVGNIHAYRATDPLELYDAADPIGPENDAVLLRQTQDSDIVICAWGTHGEFMGRGEAVRRLLAPSGKLHYLKLTKVHPHHPLYLKETTMPTRWAP